MTEIRAKKFVDCPFSAAIELAEKAVGRRKGLYVTPAPPLGERVRFTAASTDDVTDEARKHDALLIAWRPQTAKMFPEFRGVLTVRPKHQGVSLRLTGQYAPPYGPAGKVFDLFAGRMIARRTMRHLLDELAGEIESAYQEERHVQTSSVPH